MHRSIAAVMLFAVAVPTAWGDVTESARDIPVAATVDVVVVGGTTAAVAAADAASAAGAKVYLIAPRPSVGDDLTMPLRLWRSNDKLGASVKGSGQPNLNEKKAPSPLSDPISAMFGDDPLTSPTKVKSTLDAVLVRGKIPFLLTCTATELLRDGDGKIAGVVMVSRAGRQAILAKVVVDATERGMLARAAGAKAAPYATGKHRFTRVVIGGTPRTDLKSRVIGTYEGDKGNKYDVTEYTLEIDMPDASQRSFANAEQIARDLTYCEGQQFASETLFEVPPDRVLSAKPHQGRLDATAINLEAFRPAGVERLLLAGPAADLPPEAAEAFLQPDNTYAIGKRLGELAADEAKAAAAAGPVKSLAPVAFATGGKPVAGEVRESLSNIRPTAPVSSAVASPARGLPVLGEYDVVVIGGGTSGSPAGIGAARQGARTLVCEYQHGLGGVGTLGAIAKYWYGNRVGFSAEVMGGAGGWEIEAKMEWWRKALRDAKADIWFGTLGCGAVVENGRVVGAVVASPWGRGVVLAKTVIDSTGAADIAAAAGAQTVYIDETDIAMQGTGLPPRALGASYTNTDYTFSDETDLVDVTTMLTHARQGKTSFDVGNFIDTRERRRIVGDYTLTVLDMVTERTYPDSISLSKTNFDTHGYVIDPFFSLYMPEGRQVVATYTPYRCLLPKGLDGILVTGLGMSAHRDVIPVVRMQPDLQNQGYAAGVAAAMAAKAGVVARKVDIKALQKHLVEKKNLVPAVLQHQDSHPLSKEELERAVEAVANGFSYRTAAIFTQPAEALPLLRKAYAGAADAPKRHYAQLLALLGDPSGLEVLLPAIDQEEWDKGWNFKGMGQFGSSMSKLDARILAVGYTKDRKALPVLLAKSKALHANAEFSHFRALARAFEMIGDPAAAPELARLLKIRPAPKDTPDRAEALREITVARALLRCGDHDGLGKATLERYLKDPRGHFSRHAQAVLQAMAK